MNSANRAKRAYFKTRSLIVQLLDDGLPHTAKDLLGKGIRRGAAYQGLTRTWKAGLILRTTRAITQSEELFRGRLGTQKHTKIYLNLFAHNVDPFHATVLAPVASEQAIFPRILTIREL
jgi:hypothetical protein